jgi:hypothetical protein
MTRYVTGTIAQLAGKLTIEGHTLDAQELSVMTRLFDGKMFKRVGVVKKEGARGRPAYIWQVDTEVAAFFECDNTADLTLSDTDAPEYKAA